MSQFKPLLASPVEFSHLDYTNLWASAKLDGIRAIIQDGQVISRSLKLIPNRFVQERFGNRPELEGFDGELIVGRPNAPDVYRVTSSAVMSKEGECDVKFFAFDYLREPDIDYRARYAILVDHDHAARVQQHPITSEADLLECEAWMLGLGYEGVMLRAYKGVKSRYKFGRSTAKEGTLLKLKRFVDAECTVIGVEEELENRNAATTNALGHTERSSHKVNLVGKGRLGALVCETTEGIRFNIGSGFDHAMKQALWDARAKLPGRIAKFKSFSIGVKEAPRFPTFLGWRDPIDL